MRGGLLRSGSSLLALALVGACSNIIGVSGYEIDPALDEDASGGEGAGKGGTESRSGSNTGANGGEGGDGTAGSDIGGKASTGGKGSATAGAGGEPPVPDCTTAAQCDDEIDCTTDSCSAGACVHTPKDTLCDSSQCEVCTVGIGCVSGPKDVVQLLVDPNFDLSAIEWDDSGSDGTNVVTLAGAHSGTKVAKFGPAGPAAEEQDYSDLLQWVTIPEGTVALTLTGWYRATVGTKAPEDDYVVAAFYENGGTRPFSQFHSFEAASSAAPAFKMFSYNVLKSDVKEMAGNDYSFDLVAYAWDSVFYFDTLQLNATVCQ